MKLKTGDKVMVIAGSNKGKNDKIKKVLDEKVIVEGINVVKKAPIHRSNVKLINTKETTKEEKATKKETKTTKKTTKKETK